MRKRKVFRETVITVIVIALCGKLWFVICKAMVSLYQNYELVFLTLSSKAAKGEQERLERKQLGMSRFAQSCQIDIKQASEEY